MRHIFLKFSTFKVSITRSKTKKYALYLCEPYFVVFMYDIIN